MTDEPVPLATIFDEVLSLLATREDAVVFGAQPVNAYCEPERMTADIDVLSTNAARLADDVRALIAISPWTCGVISAVPMTTSHVAIGAAVIDPGVFDERSAVHEISICSMCAVVGLPRVQVRPRRLDRF